MSKVRKKLSFPGAALIEDLLREADKRGINRHQLAAELSITPPYLLALSSGARPISGLSEEKQRIMANFLKCSLIQLKMRAEILLPEDFLSDHEFSVNEQLNKVIAIMREHPDWCNVAPTEDEWNSLSQNTKIGFGLLCERELGRELLQKAQLVIVERESEENTKPSEAKRNRAN